ncbi:MAG: CBS domain-containing protein [Bacteroidota bacterium]
MVAESLISYTIVPLRTSDTGEEALSIMDDFHVKHLPIVNNEELLGLISEEDILEFDVNEPVGSYSLSLTHPYARINDHIYELMRLLTQHNLTVIPVVDNENKYVGLVSQEDLLRYFASTASFAEPGSIIVLEIGKRDYALSEIARIIEAENTTILNSFVTSTPDSTQIELTIKLSRQNIQPIIASLQRFDYIIKASFNEIEYFESLKDRYDALMAYLNI